MNFRLDINGLRFLAVTMVVLFHFKFEFAYGGFAGVDIFFVISGFLMNEICQKQIGKKSWVIDFYRKRFKRIYPALLMMVIFTFLLALYSETPNGAKEEFKQTLSALTFTSNIYYLLHSGGYFSATSDFNWLLHTWSLSVEWQFYLIFPLILVIGNLFKHYKSLFYLLIILCSVLLCILFGKSHMSANFYLLPTRMWELMIGAYVSASRLKNPYAKQTEIVAVLVLVAFFLFVKESAPWPGGMTLIPVLATGAIIHANLSNSETLFKNSVIQSIGSASYSIYLFHWPVVSFMANNSIEFTTLNATIGIILSFALGYISYKYFERLFSKSYAYLATAAAAFAAISFGATATEVNKHWVSPGTIALEKFKTYAASPEGIRQFGNHNRTCFLSTKTNDISFFDKEVCLKTTDDKKNILVLGDSHAAELYQSVNEVFPDYNVMEAAASGCMPVNGKTGEKRCTDLFNYIYNDFLVNNKVDYILLSANWMVNQDRELGKKLTEVINKIGKDKVFIIGQTKTFSIDFYKIAQKTPESKIENLVTKESRASNQWMSKQLAQSGINYIDVFDLNCSQGRCDYIDKNNVPMMFDKNHLTKTWADSYVKHIRASVGL